MTDLIETVLRILSGILFVLAQYQGLVRSNWAHAAFLIGLAIWIEQLRHSIEMQQ